MAGRHTRASLKRYICTVLMCRYLKSPALSMLEAICPHLTSTEVERSLYEGDAVALPPAKAGGPLFVALYFAIEVDEEPFVSIAQLDPTDPTPILYKDVALAFARREWHG